jgi:hypothetical protein
MPTKKKPSPKRVVYLWGAGATHAEAQRLGSTVSLLMRDSSSVEGITTRILRRTGKRVVSSFSGDVEGDIDIEKLISLLVASGSKTHADLAEQLRENYFAELKASLYNANVVNDPALAIQLFKMHANPKFRRDVERLTGIITTNHDGLLQLASQQVYGAINPGFHFESRDFKASDSAPRVIQLHGSFTWQFGMPTKISRLHRRSPYEGTLWIPPTILKETKSYPYNKLSGLAYELLARHCDLLRVVGTSLTQNDWNVLSLIFNAQRHLEITNSEPFVIELIMPQLSGEQVKRDCAYLKNVLSIGFLTEGRFAGYKTPESIAADSDLSNPFAYWLSEKQQFHRGQLHTTAGQESAEAQMGAPA